MKFNDETPHFEKDPGIFKTILTIRSVNIEGQETLVDPALISKTIDIFQKRVLLFFENNLPSTEVLEKLFKIQLLIFLIDEYYEKNWKLEDYQIAPLWNELVASLQALEVEEESVQLFLQDIKDYEKVERQMREGITPDTVEISEFYFLKSCDVRLQRNLAKFVKSKNRPESSAEEIDYDVIGEILDDVDDIEEDQTVNTYNGNRLLFCLKNNSEQAISDYKMFIDQIRDKYEDGSGIYALCNEVLAKLDSI